MRQPSTFTASVSGAAVLPLPMPVFVWNFPALPRLPQVRFAPVPAFARISARRTGIALLALLGVGLIGLFWSMTDLNGLYARQSDQVVMLKSQLFAARGRLAQHQLQAAWQRERIRRANDLVFQVEAFRRRYPLFARILKTVQTQSPRFGFHPSLILGIMQVESGFNPLAVSLAGAYGLMQIRYEVWKDELRIDRHRLLDVEYNVGLGLTILRKYFQESRGDIAHALALYNNGYRVSNPGYPAKVSQSSYCADLPQREMAIGVSD